MFSIIRGTTPTIKWAFSTIDVEDIETAFIVIRRMSNNQVVLERDMTDAIIDLRENSIAWVLEQSDTLPLKDAYKYAIHCDWKLSDGTRGAGDTIVAEMKPPGKDVVI